MSITIGQPHLSPFKVPGLIRPDFSASRKAFNKVLFITPRIAVDDMDATGSTALSWANQFLLCGSDLEHRDFNSQTPLRLAVSLDGVAIMQTSTPGI